MAILALLACTNAVRAKGRMHPLPRLLIAAMQEAASLLAKIRFCNDT